MPPGRRPLRGVFVGDAPLIKSCVAQWRAAGHVAVALVTDCRALTDWAATESMRVVPFCAEREVCLRDIAYDWALSVAMRRRLPDSLTGTARCGAVNFHDGPLPYYAGYHAPIWARMNGEAHHGITWHRITPDGDDGAIVVQRLFDIEPADTGASLYAKTHTAGEDSFRDVISALEVDAPGIAQTLTRHRPIERFARPAAGGVLRVDRSVSEALALVHALDHGVSDNPLACAKLWTEQGLYAVSAATQSEAQVPPADLCVAEDGVCVGFADGTLHLTGLTRLHGKALSQKRATLPMIHQPELWQAEAKTMAASETAWITELNDMDMATWPGTRTEQNVAHRIDLSGVSDTQFAEIVLRFAAQSTGLDRPVVACATQPKTPIEAPWRPLADAREMEKLCARPGFAADLFLRVHNLHGMSPPEIAFSLDGTRLEGAAITVTGNVLHVDPGRVPDAMASRLVTHFTQIAAQVIAGCDRA